MRRERFTFARLAILVAMTFAFAGALASPAAAQTTVFEGPCQIVSSDGTIERNCTVVFDEANNTCTVTAGEDTFQEVDGCADIVQGECPFQLIAGTTIIQLQCEGDGLPTQTPVPATNTPAPGVTPTATPVTPGVEPTATPTDVVPPDDDDDVVPPDDDDDVSPPDGDDDGGQAAPPADDADEVVEALPDTGQGPSDTNQSGILVALLGAMSALMAGAAFLFQRRTQA